MLCYFLLDVMQGISTHLTVDSVLIYFQQMEGTCININNLVFTVCIRLGKKSLNYHVTPSNYKTGFFKVYMTDLFYLPDKVSTMYCYV